MTHARPSVEHITNTSMALRATPTRDPGRWVTTLLNIADQSATFPLVLPDPFVEVQSEAASYEADPLVVPAHSWRLLSHGAPPPA